MKLRKTLLIVAGIAMFATNPWRDLQFYETVAANEGFGTIADTYIIAFAGQLIASIVFGPIAIILFVYGFGRAKRLCLIPTFKRFSWWALISSLVAVIVVLIEGELLLYCVRYAHHWRTGAVTAAYMAFTYVWWCCSSTHGETPNRLLQATS
ncbi:MAG: hypothetical protein ACYC57_10740 [Thermoleophilia bacterium]